MLWPLVACALLLGAWGLTVLARRWNGQDKGVAFYTAMVAAFAMSLIGGAALLAGPWVTGLDPQEHVYPATVWLLVLWTVIHVAVGMYMQLYCIARRIFGRLTARYNGDITNVALYWHFTALTTVVTVAVIAGFPLVS